MTNAQVIAATRDLLNEEATGHWTDAELAIYGREGETDLTQRAPVRYLSKLLKNASINKEASGILYLDGSVHQLPADYLRFQKAQDTAHYKIATYKKDMNEGLIIAQILPSYAPSNHDPICFMGNETDAGKSLVFCPSANTILLHYFREPIAWVYVGAPTPEVDIQLHRLLKLFMCYRALEKDHDALAGQFKKDYEEGLASLEE